MHAPRERDNSRGNSRGLGTSGSEAADGGLLVREIREHSVQIRHAQDFARARTEIHSQQFSTIFPCGEKTADQLPDAGAVEVRNIAKIQEHAATPFLEQVRQQFVDGFSFNEREPPSYIHHCNWT